MSNRMFFYRYEGVLHRIFIEDVLFIEASNNYTKFQYYEGQIMVRGTLENVLEQLPEDMFGRVHRSFAAAFRYVFEMNKDSLILSSLPQNQPDKTYYEVPVSKKYYQEFMKKATIVGNA